MANTMDPLCCDFCGKSQGEVKRLIAGAGVSRQGRSGRANICDECISICMVVMAQTDREWFEKQVDQARDFKPDIQPPPSGASN